MQSFGVGYKNNLFNPDKNRNFVVGKMHLYTIMALINPHYRTKK